MKNWNQFWNEVWEAHEINFHMEEGHPGLRSYFENIKPGVVLVPLCGKSKDLLWLWKKGWKVTGVELSPIACKEFFEENQMTAPESHRGLELWQGDFFQFQFSPEKTASEFHVYDRAALIALPEELRKKYVQKLKDLNPKEVFLITLEIPGDSDGPPFHVSEEEVRRLYAPEFTVECLSRKPVPASAKRNPRLSNQEVFEAQYRIRRS